MKKIVAMVVLCCFAAGIVVSQEKNPASVLKDFTRATKMEGVNLSFVLLNDKTIEVLFSGPSKYSIRARASRGTAFYVQGVSEKDMTLNNKFSVQQDGRTYEFSSINIENFAGGKVAKGQGIKGILQLDQKLNLSRPFVIKGSQNQFEFKLSDSVIKEL